MVIECFVFYLIAHLVILSYTRSISMVVENLLTKFPSKPVEQVLVLPEFVRTIVEPSPVVSESSHRRPGIIVVLALRLMVSAQVQISYPGVAQVQLDRGSRVWSLLRFSHLHLLSLILSDEPRW